MFLLNLFTSATTGKQDVEELANHLLRGIRMIRPQAIECIPGTRTSILADVATKVDDRDGANAIWIRGAPGCGKSSLSLTAKSILQRQGRLLTYFRFDRNESTTTTPTALWRCVAYSLGRRLPSVRTQLLQKLRNDKVDLDSPMDVFTSLVENPLSRITSTAGHPLVIVIDALDECGGLAGHLSPDRQALLKTLRRWSQIPKHFKLLMTSRPEGDITRVLSSISIPIEILSGHPVTKNPQAKASIDSSNDIRMFLEERFQLTRQGSSSLPADWPGSVIISGMVRRAAGVFMWATAAADFIDAGIDPRGRLRKIMDDVSDPSSMGPLYSLYAIVLEIGFGRIGGGGVEAEILRFVLGTMVLSKRPLDDIEYTKLPTTELITEDMLGIIRDRLRSVISPGSLRFVHKSFDDFLLSEECPLRYRINQHDTHHLLTKLCLKTMTEGLRFNICGLKTSYLRNADVPDIATKVANGISPLLSYSCLFFADHLSLTPFDEHLMQHVQEMMLDKLLFWFEAMSLLKEINRVPSSVLLILGWLHISPVEEFKDFLHDARRFLRAFGHPIAQSAPHIYLSALPFAPKSSSVAKHFLPQFPWILTLSKGKPANWPSYIFTSKQHSELVTCVAFSADEKRFVSGSLDGTIHIFDSETGNQISGPFNCDDWVYTVFFHPNGHRVGAGLRDGKLISWDIETGDKQRVITTAHNYDVFQRFRCRFGGSQTIISAGKTIELWNGETGRCEQHWDLEDGEYVNSSISPDGRYIALVTGQSGTNLGIWKVVDRSEIEGPVNSHPQFKHQERISAISFSIDSNFAVSSSHGGTILIWDASTGNNVGPPFSTGCNWVRAVAYSPKNYLLVSTSAMVTVWNAATHELLGRLEGHLETIFDIALSRDGQRVLTASGDGTVGVWDLGRKGGVLGTNVNLTHASEVRAVAFSRCGTKLVSLSSSLILGWNVYTGQSLFKCETAGEYFQLILSPDDRHVVAYREIEGRGIGVWSANTGALISKLNLSSDEEKFDVTVHIVFRSTDGVLVLWSDNGIVRTWNLENGVTQIIAKLPKILAFSPDGLTAVVHDNQRSPCNYIWSTTTLQPLPPVLADNEHVLGYPVAYSPSGRFLVSSRKSSQGGSTVRVWSMLTGLGGLVRFSTINMVSHLAMSPDDRHIALAYLTPDPRSQVSIFDAWTGRLISRPWGGHDGSVRALAFSPNGMTLASGSLDHQVRLWNVSGMLVGLQPSLGNLGFETHIEDGWVKGVSGKLFFWVPKDHRSRLVWPESVPFGGGETVTELDLSRFRYGESWADCFAGEN